MAYRKILLASDPAWESTYVTAMTPSGLPLGSTHISGTVEYTVVQWSRDGSVQWSLGGFLAASPVVGNNAGEVLASASTEGDSALVHPILLQDGKAVRDFRTSFPSLAVVLDVNASGLAVGYATTEEKEYRSRGFTLDVRSGDRPHFFDLPPGANSAQAVSVNAAGEVLVVATFPGDEVRSYLHVGSERRDLGTFALLDLNDARRAVGYSHSPYQAGVLDASGPVPRWTDLPLPAEFSYSRGSQINAKGLVTGFAWSSDSLSDLTAFLVDATGFRLWESLVPGRWTVPMALSEDGSAVLFDGESCVLLTPTPTVRVPHDIGHPLWELVLVGTKDDAPVFGMAGVQIKLPNGDVINLPVMPFPGDPIPGPDWRQMSEIQRRALLAAALTSAARGLEDQEAQAILHKAARKLLPSRHG